LFEFCEIWGSHGGDCDDCFLVVCDTVQQLLNLPTFRMNLLSPTLFPLSVSWRCHVTTNGCYMCTSLHGVTLAK